VQVPNQVVWASVGRSSYQGRIWGIADSIFRGNNAWPVRMSLYMSRISRPPLVSRKPIQKQKKKKKKKNLCNCPISIGREL